MIARFLNSYDLPAELSDGCMSVVLKVGVDPDHQRGIRSQGRSDNLRAVVGRRFGKAASIRYKLTSVLFQWSH